MFRCFTHHLQGEHRITCSKQSAFYNVVLCYIGYVMEHKIHNISYSSAMFFTMIEIIFCACYPVC